MSAKIQENYPDPKNGCSVGTWRCKNPSLAGIKSGMDKKTDVKVCPVCYMPLCKAHMSNTRHMTDCNFRSNQERELLNDKRVEEAKVRQERIKKEHLVAIEEAKFKEKEEIRKQIIADRNEKYKGG